MQLALYRMERPENFDQIIGQDHIVRILKNQIKTGRVSQAYLFTGTRGTGKTSTARILAKALNCTNEDAPCCKCESCLSIKNGTFMDVIELDAASNNGVDDLRAVIDSVQYPPSMGKYKVYIIDEVHMLTTAAENAFLKTLEEPPEYAVFILATTDPEKVRSTIKSRCMTLNFRRVSEQDLIAKMKEVCSKYGVLPTHEALMIIARKADGSVRDAFSILEQCIETGEREITEELVYYYTESLGCDFYMDIIESVISKDVETAVVKLDQMIRIGKDAKQMVSDLLLYVRNLLIVKCTDNPEALIGMSTENIEKLRTQSDELSINKLILWIRYLSKKVNQARYSTMPRIILEVAIIDMVGEDLKEIGENPKRKNLAPNKNQINKKHDNIKKDNKEEKKAEKSDKSDKLDEPDASEKLDLTNGNIGYDEMWSRILDEVATGDIGFNVMVGANSEITDYKDGEITLTVKPSKLSFAVESKKRLDEAAKKLFGDGTFFTLKPGETAEKRISENKDAKEITRESRDQEAREDIGKSIDKIGDVLGIDPSKIDIV